MGSGYKHREEQTTKRINVLQDELLLLEAGIKVDCHYKMCTY